jgi:hypothetical protein
MAWNMCGWYMAVAEFVFVEYGWWCDGIGPVFTWELGLNWAAADDISG